MFLERRRLSCSSNNATATVAKTKFSITSMNRFCTLLLLTLLSAVAAAQSIRIVEPPQRLPLPASSLAKLSPDGAWISFTDRSFNGIWIATRDGEDAREVCSHVGTGWGHQWSPDGRYLAVRANMPTGLTKRVGIELIDVASGMEIEVTGFLPSRTRLSLPQWSGDAVLTYTSHNALEARRVEISDSIPTLTPVSPHELKLVRWYDNAVEIHDGSAVQHVRPFQNPRQTLNAVLNPSRTSIAVEFLGRPSLYVVAADGKSQQLIDARGEAPSWLNDNHVVYMVTEDDGHRLVKGSVWIADLAGNKKQLTEGFNAIALHPSAAQDGTIIFTTETGIVYRMRIAVE
jgi:hypothetical protein